MGIQGLTTYIAQRPDIFLDDYKLCNIHLVIDGNSVGSQLHHQNLSRHDCFGGDYDKFAKIITKFFQNLSLCNVTPIVIQDGGYETRKLKTVADRMRNRLKHAYHLNSTTEGRYPLFPLFIRETFKDVVMKMGIQCVRCEFEADGAVACVARALDCPLLSYDSDFFILDTLYIQFPTLDLSPVKRYNSEKKQFEYHMKCKLYKVDKLLDKFGGMDKGNLPLLATLLGNDYIKRKEFRAFYNQLKLFKGRSNESEQQRRIRTIVMWLKNETFTSAFQKVLSRFKLAHRMNLKNRMEKAIAAYTCIDSDILDTLQIAPKVEMLQSIQVTKSSIPMEIDSDELSDQEDESSVESSESDDDIQLGTLTEEAEDSKNKIPAFFRRKFLKSLYPASFMDILTLNRYYCTPQVEDCSRSTSNSISINIVAAIHKILRGPESEPLAYYDRIGNHDIKRYQSNTSQHELPNLYRIERMTSEEKIKIFLLILDIQVSFYESHLKCFPSEWHLLLITLYYWVKHGEVQKSHIYSIVLCTIILSYVDKEIGFCRSPKSFFQRFSAQLAQLDAITRKTIQTIDTTQNIDVLIENIHYNDSLLCMKQAIPFFQMDLKMRTNVRLYDKSVVHAFSEFQGCLLHVKYLNNLMNFPFSDFCISHIFNGTFVYNMSVNLLKRNDLNAYMELFLNDCPSVLRVFKWAIAHVMDSHESEGGVCATNKNKKRRKKKKVNCSTTERENAKEEPSDEDNVYDENNRFSLLAFN